MAGKQMVIPGLPPPAPPKPKPVNIRQQIVGMESRMRRLELDLTLLRIQLDGDKEHA